MVHLGLELALGWLEGIVGWELDVEEEDTTLVGRVSWPHDHRLPVSQVVVIDGTGRDGLGAVLLEICQLFR